MSRAMREFRFRKLRRRFAQLLRSTREDGRRSPHSEDWVLRLFLREAIDYVIRRHHIYVGDRYFIFRWEEFVRAAEEAEAVPYRLPPEEEAEWRALHLRRGA